MVGRLSDQKPTRLIVPTVYQRTVGFSVYIHLYTEREREIERGSKKGGGVYVCTCP